MNSREITVACVKWGRWCEPHTAAYVNRLAAGVRKHLSRPYRFVCFTDDPTGLCDGIETAPLPENLPGSWWGGAYMNRKLRHVRPLMAVPYLFSWKRDARRLIQDDIRTSLMPIDLRGWWNKLYLFKRGTLEGRVLYIDLDTVIVGGLDPLTEYDGRFAILRDLFRQQHYGSGVMMWDGAQNGDVWDRYVRAGCPNLRRGDQAWMQRVRPDADILQDLYPSMFVSYKADCGDGLPDGARVVCYHGTPRPHEIENDWMKEHWYGLDA